MIGRNIEKIMGEKEGGRRADRLDRVLRERTELVDIGKKYGREIRLKLSLFREADRIARLKDSYQQWYDREKNAFLHSPVYREVPPLR